MRINLVQEVRHVGASYVLIVQCLLLTFTITVKEQLPPRLALPLCLLLFGLLFELVPPDLLHPLRALALRPASSSVVSSIASLFVVSVSRNCLNVLILLSVEILLLLLLPVSQNLGRHGLILGGVVFDAQG